MSALKSTSGAVLGWLLFAVAERFMLAIARLSPDEAPDPRVQVLLTLFGMLAAGAAGATAGVVAGKRPVWHSALVAALIVITGVAVLFARGAGWKTPAILALLGPSAVAGGLLLADQQRSR